MEGDAENPRTRYSRVLESVRLVSLLGLDGQRGREPADIEYGFDSSRYEAHWTTRKVL